MGKKFTKIPTTTFQELVMNAGVILNSFTPANATAPTDETIVGATSGGINFTATPTYKDYGEDIDGCPKNTKELKDIDSWEVKLSGTYATMKPTLAKDLVAAADVDGTNTDKVTPRTTLSLSDFQDLWFVGDYSDKTGATNGGYMAVHIINALSTGGFAIQTTDKEKGKYAFEYTGHASLSQQDVVPFEIYIHKGEAET